MSIFKSRMLELSSDGETIRFEVPQNIRSERLLRAVREFRGRTEADFARILYGPGGIDLVNRDIRPLEAAGLVRREQQHPDRLYPA